MPTLMAIKRSTVIALAAAENDVARQLWVFTSRELERTRDRARLMLESADQRLAAFLIEMADRLDRGDDITLPIGPGTLRIILGSPSRRCPARSRIWKEWRSSRCPRRGVSCCATGRRCSNSPPPRPILPITFLSQSQVGRATKVMRAWLWPILAAARRAESPAAASVAIIALSA